MISAVHVLLLSFGAVWPSTGYGETRRSSRPYTDRGLGARVSTYCPLVNLDGPEMDPLRISCEAFRRQEPSRVRSGGFVRLLMDEIVNPSEE